ncbi:hypothetical protein GYMLUDRAFT_441129 [Collybiopsis luxurians FD-317 M1]|uniref:RecA family profile 1 domain-containing protein n=1 Tax=Collybiopsis luxurians FD-317 M1 TaxID=944289 RepID=A0A0D0C626_9AGAR|nr:hypothetical protein GYMLUDRAFT_441129 [Collybiopsis luxurians FD-317 M1]
MLLSTILSLPDGLADQLTSLGILTDTELIFSNASPLEIYARLSPKTLSFTEFEACIEALSEKLAAPGQNILEIKQESRLNFKIETFPSLDSHLGGGLPSARVIEISGDKGSGKTTFLLNCVLSTLLQNKNVEALWIDTTGDFSTERTMDILQASQETHDELEMILQRLHVSTATDIESIQEIIRAVDGQLASDPSRRIRCIVIDTITPVVGPYLSAVSSQGHAIMTALMRYLRHLATRYSTLILVVNNATLMRAPSSVQEPGTFEPIPNPQSAFASTTRKPALGPSFTFMTDATLWLTVWPDPNEGEPDGSTAHTVEVLRSKFSSSNVWSTFKIARTGKLISGHLRSNSS